MELSGTKCSLKQLSNSKFKLLELLHRLQAAAHQTAEKVELNVSEQSSLEVLDLKSLEMKITHEKV